MSPRLATEKSPGRWGTSGVLESIAVLHPPHPQVGSWPKEQRPAWPCALAVWLCTCVCRAGVCRGVPCEHTGLVCAWGMCVLCVHYLRSKCVVGPGSG